MMRVLGLVLIFFTVASCGEDKNSGKLAIVAFPSTSALVPSEQFSCADIYEKATAAEPETVQKSITSSSLGFASGQITWLDQTRDLFVVKIQLDLENTVVAKKTDITDQDELGLLFGFSSTTGLKIPRLGGPGSTVNGVYRTDLKDFDGTPGMDANHHGCRLMFGGIAAPEKTETTVTGQLRILAITQDDAGNQEVVRANSPISVIISTD